MKAINKIIDGLAALASPFAWPLLRILSSAMFMTLGYAKLFGKR